ncbi:hypothetical protein V1283_008845 [Bradyrhizobium sp. AZCC 2262]|uniref:hypothetical protein n=1 Tax=Bradyrhizobium sp. AZCC 2262 TaxID=3117022 RepID=UPI002FF38BE0
MEKMQKLLTERRSRAAALSAQCAAAEAALAKATAAHKSHSLEGDIADEKLGAKLHSEVVACTLRVSGFDAPLAELQAHIADLEKSVADELTAIERAAAADKLAQQVSAIDAAFPKFISASGALAEALSAFGHWHFDSGQMSAFILNATAQIELASGFSLAELRATVDRIRSGDTPIPREPDTEPVALVELPPTTMTVWLLRSVRYRDHAGNVRHARQYDDCEMPLKSAHHALRCGAAVLLTDPRRRDLKGARGGDAVDPRAIDVVDLDADSAMMPTVNVESNSVLTAAGFKVIDRSGENRKLEITVPRL